MTKKIRIFLPVILMVLLIAAAIVSKLLIDNSPKPPKLTLKGNSAEINAIMGTYSWRYLDRIVFADSIAPTELAKNITPLKCKPQEAVKIKFSKKANDIMVNIWEKDKVIKQNIDHGTIIVPEEKGLYIYEISGKWNQGQALYVFTAKVE